MAYQVVPRTCCRASASGSAILRFRFPIYRIMQLDLGQGLIELGGAKTVWRRKDLLYSHASAPLFKRAP